MQLPLELFTYPYVHAVPTNACQWDLTYEHGHENRPLAGHLTRWGVFDVDPDHSQQTLLLLEITALNRTTECNLPFLLILSYGSCLVGFAGSG